MNLSTNFTLEEMLVTSTGVANIPSKIEVARLKALCVNILQPLRDKYGSPITVTSGYRSEQVNKQVKGATNSQHKRGEAADITAGNKELNKKLYELIREQGKFDQLINEYNYSWIHVSYTTRRTNRKEELVIK